MNDNGARQSPAAEELRASDDTSSRGGTKRTAAQLLVTEGALLTRSHLRELGLERRAVDAVFQRCPVVMLPGYARPLIRREHYLALLEESTFAGDRVRPT